MINGSEERRFDHSGEWCGVRGGSVEYRFPPCSALSGYSNELSEAS
jgi:hypothetical protein